MTRTPALLLAAGLLLTACGADVGVTATRSDLADVSSSPTLPSTDPTTTVPNPDDPPTTDDPDPTVPDDTGPDDTSPDDPPGTTNPPVIDELAIDFGPNKPPQDYDDFLLATLTDLDAWWEQVYPDVYGEPWEPLEGSVYAAYPDRPDDLPGCGRPRTTYDDVQQFVAFYCGQGDFIIYDDGDDGLLNDLADNFGAGTIGIVLAHEYGHAVQQRSGALDRNLPTVTTEQQADCFAGAWAARAARDEGGISFADADVRAGLIAMLEVRDPVGIDQFQPGGHGSGFDRVGAFQTGFVLGPGRCADLIDDPLPLVPNQFTSQDDLENQGNAPFGYDDTELLGFLVDDLNLYWAADAGIDGFTPLTLVPVQDPDDVACADLGPGIDDGAALCPSSNVVYLNEPVALDLYRQQSTFGDFSIGYLIGTAWAEAAQFSVDSNVGGEDRFLLNDCLTGAWVQTVIPEDRALPQPRAEGRTSVVSPGDLDEAIRTVILIGDLSADDDVVGSPFEKIDAFRTGVLGGIDACDL